MLRSSSSFVSVWSEIWELVSVVFLAFLDGLGLDWLGVLLSLLVIDSLFSLLNAILIEKAELRSSVGILNVSCSERVSTGLVVSCSAVGSSIG